MAPSPAGLAVGAGARSVVRSVQSGRTMSMRPLLASSLVALAIGFLGGEASAAPNPCGGIELTAISSCRIETSGGCKAKCEPLSLVAACDGQCNLSTETKCTGSCQADCETKCNVDPPKFNCTASCATDCRARIAVQCKGDKDETECRSYCDAMCDSDCDAQCNAVAPQADCKAKCEGSCSGSCETDANFSCTYTKCSVDLQGGCQVACDAPDGALFCDGQYLAVSDLPACIEYLATNFKVTVDVKASASASASTNNVSCAITDGPAAPLGWLAALGAAVAARVRSRRPGRGR